MVNQTSALSPPGRILVPNYRCCNPFAPMYDPCTYFGRLKYMFTLTNPLLVFASNTDIARSRCVMYKWRKNHELPPCLSKHELWKIRTLYESSFNAITGSPILWGVRLSSLPWFTGILTGSMLTYYQCLWGISTNHCLLNVYQAMRNASLDCTHLEGSAIALSFLGASAAGTITALWFNRLFRCRRTIYGRFTPAIAALVGLGVGVPMLRWRDYQNGIPVHNKDETYTFGNSSAAAIDSITAQTITRVLGIVPGLIAAPFIMDLLYRRGFICRYPWSLFPINVGLMTAFTMITIPMANAIFPRRFILNRNHFEHEIQEEMLKHKETIGVYYGCL